MIFLAKLLRTNETFKTYVIKDIITRSWKSTKLRKYL